MPLERKTAENAVLSKGWLAQQPQPFQQDVLARCLVQSFKPEQPVYRIGDPPGGVYGLVSGILAISLAPPHATERFIQFGLIGAWAGEGPFMTGDPRRVEMRAVSACTMLHLPLDAMHQLATRDPEAIRYFARMTIMHFDVLARVIDDLLIPQADRRIATVLERAGWQAQRIQISQAELGNMANASRKQVNAAIARFAASGWIKHSYRTIELLDAKALMQFARHEVN